MDPFSGHPISPGLLSCAPAVSLSVLVLQGSAPGCPLSLRARSFFQRPHTWPGANSGWEQRGRAYWGPPVSIDPMAGPRPGTLPLGRAWGTEAGGLGEVIIWCGGPGLLQIVLWATSSLSLLLRAWHLGDAQDA